MLPDLKQQFHTFLCESVLVLCKRYVCQGTSPIRRYEPSDEDHVWTIHERALRASPLPFIQDAPPDDDITDISDQYLDTGGEFLVGLTGGEIVATGGFQPQGNEVVMIRRMRVDPSSQRQGYGERILPALEERAREQGFTRGALSTHEHLSAAQALYTKHGYEGTHREIGSITGGVMIHYEKELGNERPID